MKKISLLMLLPFTFALGCASSEFEEENTLISNEAEARESIHGKTNLRSANAYPGDRCASGCVWSPFSVVVGAQTASHSCDGEPCACVAQGDVSDLCVRLRRAEAKISTLIMFWRMHRSTCDE